MSDLKRKELVMRKLKGEAAIAELEFKIEERKIDIERLVAHIQLQKEQITKAEEELSQLS